ncbi:hypothetical protein LTR97_000517 [Elasticomyces elasticus]|uniref:Uncharacterized protein n=1 Tax=Elasticomyces elasticus TaxID=574655 RepID=A0AAN7WCX2_9PEZI|nr:hypothetical protein LTR97_000517 [Elasticomyces elasticus]
MARECMEDHIVENLLGPSWKTTWTRCPLDSTPGIPTPPNARSAQQVLASAETGGGQQDNTFLLLKGNNVIKGGKRMLLKLVEFPDLGIDPTKGLTKQAAVSKKKYNNQYTSFKDKDNDLPYPDAIYDSRATVLCLAAAYDGEVSFGKSELRTLKHNFTVRDDSKADVPGGQAAFIEYPDRVTTMWSARISVAHSSVHNYEADGTT